LIPRLTTNDKERYNLFAKSFLFLKEGYVNQTDPLTLSVALYQKLYTETGNMDPYIDLKRLSRVAAEKALPVVTELIESKEDYDKFRATLAATIAGNIIDFNTAGHDPDLDALEKTYHEVLDTGFTIDDSHSLWEKLNSSPGTLVYLGDNAGEVLFDIPLIKLVTELGWKVFFVVKGKAMINDATTEDIHGTEIESLAEVIDTGAWAFGTPRSMVSKVFLEAINTADLVISKGQANIESFPEIADEVGVETYYLLRGKCEHIASRLGAAKGDNLVLKHSAFRGSS
jgi:uncharacterized protein with ATP-grasp and redox domains